MVEEHLRVFTLSCDVDVFENAWAQKQRAAPDCYTKEQWESPDWHRVQRLMYHARRLFHPD